MGNVLMNDSLLESNSLLEESDLALGTFSGKSSSSSSGEGMQDKGIQEEEEEEGITVDFRHLLKNETVVIVGKDSTTIHHNGFCYVYNARATEFSSRKGYVQLRFPLYYRLFKSFDCEEDYAKRLSRKRVTKKDFDEALALSSGIRVGWDWSFLLHDGIYEVAVFGTIWDQKISFPLAIREDECGHRMNFAGREVVGRIDIFHEGMVYPSIRRGKPLSEEGWTFVEDIEYVINYTPYYIYTPPPSSVQKTVQGTVIVDNVSSELPEKVPRKSSRRHFATQGKESRSSTDKWERKTYSD
jgi:hypothetical protein